MNQFSKIICETACSHQGSVNRLKNYINFAGINKVDFIQFQIWKKENISTKDNPNFSTLTKLEIFYKDWKKIINYTKKKYPDLSIIACVYDDETLNFCAKQKIKHFKLHASDINNYDLLESLRKLKAKVNLSVGSSSMNEIKNAIKIIPKKNLCLMYGMQLFPTDHNIINLQNLNKLQKKFRVKIGYQDHTDPKKLLSYILPLFSLGLGVQYIEKHITDLRSKKRADSEAAFTIKEYSKFIYLYKAVKQSVFSEKIKHDEALAKYKNYYKKIVIAKKKILPKQKFSKLNLSLKWSKIKKDCYFDIKKLLGKKSKKNFKINEPIIL